MEKNKIGIDFDGTYVRTGDLVRSFFNEKYNEDINPACLHKNIGNYISKESFDQALLEISTNRDYIEKLEEQPNATNLIKMLSQKNNVKIMTSRVGDELSFAKEYLERKGLGHLLENNPKERDKEYFAKGLDIFVEDVPYRAISLSNIVPQVVLFTTYDNLPSNLSSLEKKKLENVRRIYSWEEMLDMKTKT